MYSNPDNQGFQSQGLESRSIWARQCNPDPSGFGSRLFFTVYTKEQFKLLVKRKINIVAMDYLKEKQQSHSKVREIAYPMLETAQYLRSPLFDAQSIELLFSLRTRTVRGIRKDFKGMFIDHSCPLACGDVDTLQNVLSCNILQSYVKNNTLASELINYEDIFSNDVRTQRQVTELYSQLLTIREQLLDSSPVTETGPVH